MPRTETNDQRRQRMTIQSVSGRRRQITISISGYLTDALKLAGERAGIRNISHLIEMAVLHYLTSCAEAKALSMRKELPPSAINAEENSVN